MEEVLKINLFFLKQSFIRLSTTEKITLSKN